MSKIGIEGYKGENTESDWSKKHSDWDILTDLDDTPEMPMMIGMSSGSEQAPSDNISAQEKSKKLGDMSDEDFMAYLAGIMDDPSANAGSSTSSPEGSVLQSESGGSQSENSWNNFSEPSDWDSFDPWPTPDAPTPLDTSPLIPNTPSLLSDAPLPFGNTMLSPFEGESDINAENSENQPKEPKYKKLEGGPKGSNEGGWYEKTATGEKFYVKFYENPDQGRVECLTNRIYDRLGIKAVKMSQVTIDGRPAVSSKEVKGAVNTGEAEQRESRDVRKGFIADAFLANWDVVGAVNDNIVRGEDGGMYRIDNGGAMIFRARGGDKEFSPNEIPELETMMRPGHRTGDVFAGLSEEEMRNQAQDLVYRLRPYTIKELVNKSGLEGEARDRVLSGLLGRRDFLIQRFGLSERQERTPYQRHSLDEVVHYTTLETERSQETNEAPRHRGEVVCDHDHIEDQRMDIIDAADLGSTIVQFKMRRNDSMRDVLKTLKEKSEQPDSGITASDIESRSKGNASRYSLASAYSFESNGLKVRVADDKDVRSSHGLVKIEAPRDMSSMELETSIQKMMAEVFNVDDATGEVSYEAESVYKDSRYKWLHKIDGELTEEQKREASELVRAEVFPGYSTFVQDGLHEKLFDKYGECRAVHQLRTGDVASIARVLTSGIMCSSERYSRGVFRDGMSTKTDFGTGGADSVFTRTFSMDRLESALSPWTTTVVFKPEIFDRTDYYSYDSDHFGRTNEADFNTRLSPEKLVEWATSGRLGDSNEQMFRKGIGADSVEKIVIKGSDDYSYKKIIAQLRSMDIESFGGHPIDEVVVFSEASFDNGYEWNDFSGNVATGFALTEEQKQAQQEMMEHQKECEEKIEMLKAGQDVEISFTDFVDTIGDLSAFEKATNTIMTGAHAESFKKDLRENIIEYAGPEYIESYLKGELTEQYDIDALNAFVKKFNLDFKKLLEKYYVEHGGKE